MCYEPPAQKKTEEERGYMRLQRARVVLPVWPAYHPRRSPGETSVRGPIVA